MSTLETLDDFSLMKHDRMTLLQAYHYVKAARPIIRPNVGFFRQMVEYERKLRGNYNYFTQLTTKLCFRPCFCCDGENWRLWLACSRHLRQWIATSGCLSICTEQRKQSRQWRFFNSTGKIGGLAAWLHKTTRFVCWVSYKDFKSMNLSSFQQFWSISLSELSEQQLGQQLQSMEACCIFVVVESGKLVIQTSLNIIV